MEIRTDDEGRKAVLELCDIALKQGGLAVMQGVARVLQAVNAKPEPEDEPCE